MNPDVQNVEVFQYSKKFIVVTQKVTCWSEDMRFKTGKIIPMVELIRFCDEYNSTGYGKAKVIDLKNHIIVELYNAGWSDNESMDIEFYQEFQNNVIYRRHPIMIAEFNKRAVIYSSYVADVDNSAGWGDCYSKQDKYTYEIEIEE
jgi:hypothetical protein